MMLCVDMADLYHRNHRASKYWPLKCDQFFSEDAGTASIESGWGVETELVISVGRSRSIGARVDG